MPRPRPRHRPLFSYRGLDSDAIAARDPCRSRHDSPVRRGVSPGKCCGHRRYKVRFRILEQALSRSRSTAPELCEESRIACDAGDRIREGIAASRREQQSVVFVSDDVRKCREAR
jgi:hypothetical protein